MSCDICGTIQWLGSWFKADFYLEMWACDSCSGVANKCGYPKEDR